jgi:hypothetical protein
MTNILDTVEPVAWRAGDGFGDYFLSSDFGPSPDWEQLYSRETVERLLEAHRKQVLLEVIAKAEKNILPAISTYELLRMVNGEK